MSRYRLCGLTLESDLPLPELPLSDGLPDAIVEIGPIPKDGPAEIPRIGPLTRADRHNLWLAIPKVARFWVRGGNRIVIDPEPGSDEASIRNFLLASPLAALLFQRDRLVMHGAAVEINGQAILILGSSGSGKSTLAAELMKRGHRIVADDVIALDEQHRALPGIPRLKLWRNALKMLDIPRDDLTPVRPGLERYHLPLADAVTTQPSPVRWVVLLSATTLEEIVAEPLWGMNRFMPLRKNTYRISFMDHMGLKTQHMAQIAALSGHIRLWALSYPGGGDYVGALTDRLLDLVHTGEA